MHLSVIEEGKEAMTGRNCTSLIIHAKAGCLEKRDYKSDGGQITQWSNVISFQSISNV